MNDDNGFITRTDWRVIRGFVRNLVVAAVFVLCAWVSQWAWGLILDPSSWPAKTATALSQLVFALGAAAHVLSGVISLVHYSFRDTWNQIRDRRN